jgi:serine/threonine-protein kinase
VTGERGEPQGAAEARVGETLNGKWRVDRLIDVGGMGAVYAATHRNGRRAAIKVLHAQFAQNPEVRRRFLREGYVANKIGHPGALAILDDDVAEDGAPFLVMELLEGESFSAWLERSGGRLPAVEVIAVAGQVLHVLEVAHANGVVHRDIKPGNVFVTREGHAKLLDFGLARIRDGSVALEPTAVGIVMGTAGYMAPEQARGHQDNVDARSDIFAVAAVMFRALTGQRIHEKDNAFDTTIAAMKDPAPSLASVMPSAGPHLIAAVDRALAFDKAGRWQNAREMIGALRLAYDEARRRAPPPLPERAASPESEAPETLAPDSHPSLVVEVAFGPGHEDALVREQQRTREVIEGLSRLTVVVPERDD